jgi:hypothetical protein
MRRSQAVQKQVANQSWIPTPNVQVGSNVWLHSCNVRSTWPSRKLDWKHLRPVLVQRQVSPYAYELALPASIQIQGVQPISHLDPVVQDSSERHVVALPPPVDVDAEEEYHVSSVKHSLIYRNQSQYRTLWTGYDSLNWKPVKFVDGLQAVGQFHQRYPGRPGPLENAIGGPRA